MTHIYTLNSQDGIIRYVGKTSKSLRHRLSNHLCEARRGTASYKNNWIRSMLNRGMIPTIHLLEIVNSDGNEAERRWIAYFKRNGIKLVNMTDGGDGFAGLVISEQHKAKISSALTGIKRSEETKALIRAARAKQAPAHTTPHSDETKRKIREVLADSKIRKSIGDANRGRIKTKSEIEKMRLSNIEYWNNPQNKQKMLDERGTRVLCVETGIIYPSTGEAAKSCSGQRSLISRVCKDGKRHKGLHWRKA